MQQASLQGFLLTILYIILIYYGVKFIGRLVFPVFFNKILSNIEKKVREQQGYQNPDEEIRVGETVIQNKPKNTKESDKDLGEYVDYEEVEEK